MRYTCLLKFVEVVQQFVLNFNPIHTSGKITYKKAVKNIFVVAVKIFFVNLKFFLNYIRLVLLWPVNEQTVHLMGSNRRRPWTLANPEELQMGRCIRGLGIWRLGIWRLGRWEELSPREPYSRGEIQCKQCFLYTIVLHRTRLSRIQNERVPRCSLLSLVVFVC